MLRVRERASGSGVRRCALAFGLLFSLSCAKKNALTEAPTDSGGFTELSDATAVSAPFARLRTTSWSIASHNLNAEIDERLRRDAADGPSRLALVEFLLERGQFVANIADYELADAVASKAVKALPGSHEAHFARALTHGALHRFEAELKELDEAKALGAVDDRIASARAAVFVATGRYDEADKLYPPLTQALRPAQLVTRAVLLGHMQKPDEAERLFERARAAIVDVSPFPVAWMEFQRGTSLEANGKANEALRYFTVAVEAIPDFAHAAVHLASLESPSLAIARLEALRKKSTDADVVAALATAYRRDKRDEDAARTLEDARMLYEARVAQHPEAYADHAARFYLTLGNDPKRALALAAQNAKVRPTEEALDLWMTAAAAAVDKGQLCASASVMQRLVYASVLRKRMAAATSSGCPGSSAPTP